MLVALPAVAAVITSWAAAVQQRGAVSPLGQLPARCALVRAPPVVLQVMDDPPDDEDETPKETSSEELDAMRAQLMRQFGGGGGAEEAAPAPAQEEQEEDEEDEEEDEPDVSSVGSGDVEDDRARLSALFGGGPPPEESAESGAEDVGKARESGKPAKGAVLVANPQRFCSRNPFARAVKDLHRFGLQGPVSGNDLSADTKAQMLPVLLLIEHGDKGSMGLLLERRTGALMGDISMDEYGCVAISPLWLGGTEQQNSLFCVHNVKEVSGTSPIRDDLFLGGWDDARPKVSDSTYADSRFKFFLGTTEWKPGQLQEEIEAGAWLVLDCDADLVMKDRVSGWQPGKPKPLWTELVRALGDDFKAVMQLVYADE